MKKIVVCIALAIISMMSAAASFLVNDAPAYRNWAQVNRPKIMETFGRDKKEKPGKMPPPAVRPGREAPHAPMMNPSTPKMEDKDHHQSAHDKAGSPAALQEEGNQ